MAGAAGFEPAHAGTKNQCLTTWRRPNIIRTTCNICATVPDNNTRLELIFQSVGEHIGIESEIIIEHNRGDEALHHMLVGRAGNRTKAS